MNRDEEKVREAFQRKLSDLQPSTSVESIRRGAKRGRMITALTTVLFVSVAGGGGYALLQTERDDQGRVVGPGPESEDGLIAFVTQEPGEGSLWIAVVPVSGGEATRLREGRDPAWSPDGSRIAFGCDRGICTMDADGSDVERVTEPPEGAIDESPDWGPDDRILFTRTYLDQPGRGRDLFVTPFPGKPEQRIGHADPDDSQASWSPDGKHIAFIRGVGEGLEAPAGGFQLFIANDDGGQIRQLTTKGAGRPDWSPDGRSILFDEASALWTIPAEGGEPQKLPVVTANDVGSFPSWAPDSHRLAFSCEEGVCLSDVDAEELTVLVTNGGSPAWQPIVPAEGSSEVATFGRYVFHIQDGSGQEGEAQEQTGVVEVNAEQGTICLNSYLPGTTAALLRREGDDPWRFITIFDLPTRYRPSLCARGLDEPSLQAVIDDPTEYSIEIINKLAGESVTVPLEIMDDPSATWTSHTDEEHDFTVEYPSDWTRAEASLTPNLSDPVEILSVGGGFAFRPGGDRCAQVPTNALEDFGINSVFYSIQESGSTEGFAERPSDLEMLANDEAENNEVIDCVSETERDDFEHLWWIRFRDGDRAFYALVAVGVRTDEEMQAELWRSINSFTPLSREGGISTNCQDGTGDLLSEGSGDQSGPGPQPPDEDHPGTDLTGFSMARYPDGTLEMNFGTKGVIPQSLEPDARLYFVLSATPKGGGTAVAAVTASLKNDDWEVRARNDDDESEIPVTPEIAGNVLNLVINPQYIPRLMRGAFRWSVHSEWVPEPTKSASEIYADYCPDSGFPRFEGSTT